MQPNGLCDACGTEVPPEEAYRAELTAGQAMCPTPMLYHRSCFERASQLWQPDPDSLCSADPLFPETAQWTTPPDVAAEP